MRQFELTFEVPEMAETVEDAVADNLDAVIATHYGVTTVTVTASGPNCLVAAASTTATLRRLGAPARRLIDDLVTRGEIAERAGVTRQAVGLWVRGERHGETPFPAPFVLNGGAMWLWGEVVEALAARGITLDQDVDYPTRADAQVIGGLLAAASSAASWSVGIETSKHFAVTVGDHPGVLMMSAPHTARTDFALFA